MKRHVLLVPVALLAAACSASTPDPGSGTDDMIEAPGGGGSCTPTTALPDLGFEEDAFLERSVEAKHGATGDAIGTGLAVDAKTGRFVISAMGEGAFKGNAQTIDAKDVSLCNGTVKVAPNAHIVFSGEGLTTAEMEGCAKDMKRAECATLAHYCRPGTLTAPKGAPASCELANGRRVMAGTFDASGCVPGSAFHMPGFDEELPTIATGSASNDTTGFTVASNVKADPKLNAVTVTASGSGAFAGNFQVIQADGWALCGGKIKVTPGARIGISPEGITKDQLAACAKNPSASSACATLAHYCEAGSITTDSTSFGSCALKAGIKVEATVFGPAGAAAAR